MTTQPIIPAVLSTLLPSDHWAESLALQVMQENSARFMGKLAPSEQRDCLCHCKDQIDREKNLAEAMRSFYDNLEQQMLRPWSRPCMPRPTGP
ncbi:MAG: hypothetical protein GAK32_01529 [Pseudomonas fluorescens]|nr:MAG: hypothetical protein GAK32_01529 [Pseudomonas fluorescens]